MRNFGKKRDFLVLNFGLHFSETYKEELEQLIDEVRTVICSTAGAEIPMFYHILTFTSLPGMASVWLGCPRSLHSSLKCMVTFKWVSLNASTTDLWIFICCLCR